MTAKRENAYPGLADYGDIMSLAQVARYVGVSPDTVSRLGHYGRLTVLDLSPSRRAVRKTDLVEYLDRQAQQAADRQNRRPKVPIP